MAAASEVTDDDATERQRFRFHRAPQTPTQQSERTVLQKARSPLKTINMLSLLVADTLNSTDLPLQMGRVAHIPAHFVGSGRSFSTFYGHYDHGYPIVFKRVRFNTGEPLRIADEQWEPRAGLVQAISLELRALTHPPLREHENIVKLLGFGWENDLFDEKYLWPVLIVEYADCGNLSEYLSDHPGLSVPVKAELCRDIARGLITLHRCGVVHGDVKCNNILVFNAEDRASGCRAKVADFGFSLLDLEDEAVLLARSPPWNAPEWNERNTRAALAKSDVYSFGLIALQVFANGANPFETLDIWTRNSGDSLTEIEHLKQRDELLPLFESQVKDLLTHETEIQLVCSILRQTLKRDPEERDLNKVLEHLDSFLGNTSPEFTEEPSGDDTARLTDNQGLPNTRSLLQGRPQRGFPFEAQRQVVQGLVELTENETVERIIRGFAAAEVGFSFVNGYGQEKANYKQAKDWFVRAVTLGFMQAGPLIHRYAKAGGIPSWLDDPGSYTLCAGFVTQGSRVALEDLKEVASDEIYSEALTTLRREFMGVGMGYFLPELLDRFTITDITKLESQIRHEGVPVDNIGPFGRSKGSLLHFAACYGAADAVKFLLQQGADVNRRTVYGETALLYACRSGHYIPAQILLKNGADIKLGHYRDGDTPFHWLVNMDEEHVEEVVGAMPADDVRAMLLVDAEDANYSEHVQIAFGDGPPLLWAVAYRHTAFIKLLLDLGADPFQQSRYTGLSPVALAAMRHLHDSLDLLLEKVQPSGLMPNDRQRTPLGVAISSSTVQARCLTHGSRHIEAMQHTIDVLIKHGTSLDNVGSRIRPQTALDAAVGVGALDIVEYLLQHGCKHQVSQRRPRTGYAPLHEAILQGHTDIFNLLVENGADVSLPYKDNAGNFVHTIFMCLRSMRETEAIVMVEYILSDPEMREEAFNALHNGAPPLALAIEFRQYKLAQCFINHGADINQEFFQKADGKRLTMLGHLLDINRTAEQSLSPLRFLLQPTADGNYESASFITCRETNESALHTFVNQMSETVDGTAAQAILLYLLSVFGQPEHIENTHTGVTPLQSAAGLAWYPSTVEILLDHGANPNHICTVESAQLGMTPLDMVLHACKHHPILKHPHLAPEFLRRAGQTITILRRRGARRGVELATIWNTLLTSRSKKRPRRDKNNNDDDSDDDDSTIFDLLWKSLGIKTMADFIPMSRALQCVCRRPYLEEHDEHDVFEQALRDAAFAGDAELVEALLRKGADVSYDHPDPGL